ncbi:hypothetical protein N7470_010094 [Penicillium chermesinum]|nr:hypothetical protein N7470_010094 [Penicillium chermesinum]
MDATLTTQGEAADPEQIWEKFDRTAAFTSRALFPSDTQIDYVASNILNTPIYSEASLRNFERDTVDNFVEKVVNALRDDETLRREFGIQGRVTFYDRANPSETSLENSLEQMNLQDTRTPQRAAITKHGRRRGRGSGATQIQRRDGTVRRRNRRADQFCVHLVADERQIPVYAVEFKAPHKVTIPELVAGLHRMDLARDVIEQEGDTFEFYATRLVAAVVTQIFSYMIDSGVRYGYICTGEGFVFLHIPEDDPTIVQYFLCIPNQDVQPGDELRLHRTAIGQVLAFTLQALAAGVPPQEWHDVAHDTLRTWEIRGPLTIGPRIGNEIGKSTTRALALAVSQTHLHHGTRRLKAAAAIKNRNRHPLQQRHVADRAAAEGIAAEGIAAEGAAAGLTTINQGRKEFTHQLHRQLIRNRDLGFEQLHICGRTGYLIKATLLSSGYTVIIKATTVEKQRRLQAEVDNYRHLKSLQGQHIPMMVLSWSGTRLQHVINDGNSSFFHEEREKALAVLRSHGVIHGDSDWRNMLWDKASGRLVVIDLEDVKRLKRPGALELTSGNVRHSHLAKAVKSCACSEHVRTV